MPNYRELYTRQAGVLATVIEELDNVSAWAKAQQQAHEDVVIETEPPALKVVPTNPPPKETEE